MNLRKHLRRVAALCLFILCIIGPPERLSAGVYVDVPTRLWPGGIVPYEVDQNDPPNVYSLFVLNAAMVNWSNVAHVQFVPRNGEANYLLITNAGPGPAYPPPVGYRGNGAHTLYLNNWGSDPDDINSCTRVFGLAHEVGHVLGLMHTHQSVNRNAYFIVDTTRLTEGTSTSDWNIIPTSLEWPPNQADVDSIMSYPLCTLSSCGNDTCVANLQVCAPILLVNPYSGPLTCSGIAQCPPPVVCVGQRNHLSDFDQKLMSYLYPQADWRFANSASTQTQETGSFHYPAKSFATGQTLTPVGGTLWLEPGSYSAVGVYGKGMVLRATRTGDAILH